MAIGHWPWQLQWRFVGGGAILCGIHLPRGEGEVGRACLRDSRPPHPLDYYPVKNRSREPSLTCVCILHTPIRNNMCTWSCAQSCQQYAQCPCARVFPILGQGLTTEFNQVQTICFLKISIPHVSFADVDIQMQTKKRPRPRSPWPPSVRRNSNLCSSIMSARNTNAIQSQVHSAWKPTLIK